MFDRLILLAFTPMTIAGGAIGWTTLAQPAQTFVTTSGSYAGEYERTSAIVDNNRSVSRHLTRRSDGLFYAIVLLNSHPVEVIVDTGASKSILSRDVTRTIVGLNISHRTVGTMRTLAGDHRYKSASVDRVRMGSQDVGTVEFAVLDTDSRVSVIGQDVLRQLGPIILDGDRLTLR